MRFSHAPLLAFVVCAAGAVVASPLAKRAADAAGYVSMTFIGDQPDIFAHYASPGKESTFTALNGGKPILVPTQGTKGVRDPYFVKAPGGDRYWVIGVSERTDQRFPSVGLLNSAD